MQEFQSGDTINNRYTVLRKLGAGAMGAVYLCEDRVEKNIKVALKVLISENLDDQDLWAKGEYEALTHLRHPNLARVYNFGRIGDSRDYFIVSEFIKGIDLFSATEYINYEEGTDILVQTCRALEYIHSQGYVHFDIKPDNILVTRHKTVGLKEGSKVQYEDNDFKSSRSLLVKPKVKLIDFGLAEKITGSFSFAIKGTLNYLAPEILNGTTPDKRADLYSLGVTMYQVFNRDLPFYQDFGGFPGETSVEKRSDLFELNMKKHPDYLQELIMRLLEEKPEDRFQSAKEVIQFINRKGGFAFEVETEETRASYFHTPRLVGRSKEMGVLKRHYEQVFFPHSGAEAGDAVDVSDAEAPQPVHDSWAQLIILNGEIGSGKSRLLEEFRHFLKLSDLDVYLGNCYEGHQKAYQPIIEILRQLVFDLGPDSELYAKYKDHVLMLLPEFRDRRTDGKRSRAHAPHNDKHYFIERITQLLVDVAAVTPYVLVVNNLHWVDDASVDLLENLFDRMLELRAKGQQLKLLSVASQRAEEQSSERVQLLLEKLRDREFCLEMQVRRLKMPQIREFLQSLLGLTDIPEDFVAHLEAQTGGNPLFMVETLKALQDEGILKHEGDGWSLKSTKYNRVEIPQSMEDLLLQRLGRLEPLKRQVLDVLAVLDKPVNPKFLQTFKRFASSPILVTLRELEAAGIVQKLFDNGKLHFQIEQSKIREILYSNLTDTDRHRYHGEVGDALEEAYGSRQEEILEELAYHYQRSDRTGKAVKLALKAGDRLKAIYASERACEYFLYVLELVAEDPQQLPVYLETREKLGEICTIMGRYDEAEEHYRSLLSEDCRELLPPERVTNLFLRRGKVFEIQGDYDSALKCYKDARNYLSSYGGKQQVVERARVYNSIGWVYVCMGKFEKAMTISLEALRVISEIPERIEHAMVYTTIGSANYFKGNIREATEYHRKSLQIKENLENIPEIIISLNDLGKAHLAGAEYGEAADHLRRALSTSEEIGDPYGRAMTLHNLGRLYLRVGDVAQAEEVLEESIGLSKSYSMRQLSLQNYGARGALLTESGDYAKAEGNLFRVLTSFSKQGNRSGLCAILLDVAVLHRKQGNADEAQNLVEEASRYAEELGIHYLRARCLLEEARLLRSEGEGGYEKALNALEEALALAAKGDDPEFPAEINFEIAETLVSMREVREAKKYYRLSESQYRDVLSTLPRGFRAVYEARLEAKFGSWHTNEPVHSASVTLPASEDDAEAPAEEVSSRTLWEDSLKRVNELMRILPTAESPSDFLGKLLEDVLGVSSAEQAFLLSLSGRNLNVLAARDREGGPPAQPAESLHLAAIEKALAEGQPLFLDRGSGDDDSRVLSETDFDAGTLAVLPFLEPDGKRGALYLVDPVLPEGSRTERLMFFQPFLNFLPLTYHHFAVLST